MEKRMEGCKELILEGVLKRADELEKTLKGFYQARVDITQIPLMPDQSDRIERAHATKDYKMLREMSWLCNPFGDDTVYCSEIALRGDFRWSFLFKDLRREKVKVRAHAFLLFMKERYPGLDGKVTTCLVRDDDLNYTRNLFELRLRPAVDRQFNLFNKITSLMRFKSTRKVLIYLLWQQTDAKRFDYEQEFEPEYCWNDYKVKVYVSLQVNEAALIMNYLGTEATHRYLMANHSTLSPPNTWRAIHEADVFWNNYGQITGRFFQNKKLEIPDSRSCTIFVPEYTDFYVSNRIPLPHVPLPPKQSIIYPSISEADPHYICLGAIVDTGVLSNHPALLDINLLTRTMIIGGKPGTGKTTVVMQICQQIRSKAPDVGLLNLNLGKKNQEGYYCSDRVLKYGDAVLSIPYFVRGLNTDLDEELQQTASYLIASLGLKNPLDQTLKDIMRHYMIQYRKAKKSPVLPELEVLLNALLKWYKNHSYHENYQKSVIGALTTRISHLRNSSKLARTMQLCPDLEAPEWLAEWADGASIYIDLSSCDIYDKALLVNAILQAIRVRMSEKDSSRLKSLIIIDEAHNVTLKDAFETGDGNMYGAWRMGEQIFTQLLQEFRSRGLGFILADQRPSSLFETVTELPSLFILFCLGRECIQRFSDSPEEREYLSSLRDRHAYFKNFSTREYHEIRTKDYNLEG